ncbi:MAG: hypothetical protein AABX79_01395 [Nanoarchaeota archaeon]
MVNETHEGKNESFAYEHGKLTYQELTMKDRYSNLEDLPALAETLQVGPFKREYWCVSKEKAGDEIMCGLTGWKVIQQNFKANKGNKQPVEWVFDYIHAPSKQSVYNPLFFGGNLEYRARLKIDISDLSFLFGFCTKESANCRGPLNAIWFSENGLFELNHRPHLLSKNDYIELMRIHHEVLCEKDKKTADISRLLPTDISLILQKSFEHLNGFVSAAEDLGDEIRYEISGQKSMYDLVKDFQKLIQN